jgi:primosomal protein DnaI
MQNLKDLMILDENFLQVREESVSSLMKDPVIQEVMQKQQVDKTDITNNWADFLNYQEDYYVCNHCLKLEDCPKVSKGMRYVLEMQEGQSTLLLKPCRYGEIQFENQNILNHIVLKNVDERIVLTTTDKLTILKQDTGNEKNVFSTLANYVKQPTDKGFYLYGNSGIGKSTLMGWLVRSLISKQGVKCGFIHFPTFLIDLKNKFGEEGIHESMELMKNLEYLVIDDIGGENVTVWSRDEILSSVLAYRGQSGKATFFTSNYSLAQLSELYILKNGDTLRVNRLLERMKAVSNELELKGKSLR